MNTGFLGKCRNHKRDIKQNTIELAKRIVAGESLTDIGRDLSITKQCVEQFIITGAYNLDHPQVVSRFNEYEVSEIKVAIAIKGLNVEKLSEISGLSKAIIFRIVSGRHCKYDTAERIADALGFPIGSLFEAKEDS